jgi:methylmalonyl-CoA mutase cobalamin-binding domain/chain
VKEKSPAPRVVLAKIGLDGHDRGVKVVARGLRDSGFHVIYAGLWQPIEAVVQTALDEDADWLGISLLSGAHMALVPPLMKQLREKGLEDVGVMVGGIIPEADIPKLEALGVRAIFGPGTTIPEIVGFMKKDRAEPETDDLVRRFRDKDRRALARLLTKASRGDLPENTRKELAAGREGEAPAEPPRERQLQKTARQEPRPPERASALAPKGRVVAFTGSGGVGKSSLIGRLVELLRAKDRSVAVLCCDPQSPLTGGALLGDRLRIAKGGGDLGLFIRSLATPGGQQAIAQNLDVMVALLKNYGFDTVILETVGAGQGDTAVRQQADVLVVLLQPESGDELQWEKAGLLEVADLVVIHKADLPGADRVAAQVNEHLNLPGTRPIPVLKASAAKGEGLDQLWATIEQHSP